MHTQKKERKPQCKHDFRIKLFDYIPVQICAQENIFRTMALSREWQINENNSLFKHLYPF